MSDITQQNADTLQQVWLNDYNQRLAVQRLAYAEACGQPLPANCGISNTTVHNYPSPQASSPAAAPAAPSVGASQPTTGGLLGFLSNPIVAAGLGAIGGPGLMVAGSIIGNLFNKPSQPATPAPAPQVVDLGTIGPDGKIVTPQ